MNRHQILYNWVSNFFTDNEVLQFDSLESYPGARTLVPDYGDFTLATDILGNEKKAYNFAFVGTEPLSFTTDNQNQTNLSLFDEFSQWIIEQDKQKNYPDFGENIVDYKLTPLQNMANRTYFDESSGLAKYILGFKLEYTQKNIE